MYLQDQTAFRCQLGLAPCERPKKAMAEAIGARLRDVFPLRDDEADFAELLAALDQLPGSRSIH